MPIRGPRKYEITQRCDGGIISKSLRAFDSFNVYQGACKQAENVFSDLQGRLIKRPGLVNIEGDDSKQIRLFTLDKNTNENYTICLRKYDSKITLRVLKKEPDGRNNLIWADDSSQANSRIESDVKDFLLTFDFDKLQIESEADSIILATGESMPLQIIKRGTYWSLTYFTHTPYAIKLDAASKTDAVSLDVRDGVFPDTTEAAKWIQHIGEDAGDYSVETNDDGEETSRASIKVIKWAKIGGVWGYHKVTATGTDIPMPLGVYRSAFNSRAYPKAVSFYNNRLVFAGSTGYVSFVNSE